MFSVFQIWRKEIMNNMELREESLGYYKTHDIAQILVNRAIHYCDNNVSYHIEEIKVFE